MFKIGSLGRPVRDGYPGESSSQWNSVVPRCDHTKIYYWNEIKQQKTISPGRIWKLTPSEMLWLSRFCVFMMIGPLEHEPRDCSIQTVPCPDEI